jgi:DNA-binding transcriptional regulator GbsR (MarR family)
MGNPDGPDGQIDDPIELVDSNGLVKLFANRVRTRVLVTLFYAGEPLTTAEIADGAGVHRTAAGDALDAMAPFDVVEERSGRGEEADAPRRYSLREDDDLVAAVRTVAELATDRYYRS